MDMLNVEQRPLAEITPYEKNPRHNANAIDAVAASIEQFGFRQPIVVDEAGVIVVGHTRWKAARKLGLETAPVHIARDPTPEQIRAYRVADNKTADLATWNLNLLAAELTDLRAMDIDLSLLGFDEDDLAKLLGTEIKDGLTDPDAVPEPPDEAVTKPGDLIILGDHRLRQPLIGLAWVLHARGELADAETHVREAIEIHRRVYGDGDEAYLGWALGVLGNILYDKGEFDEAATVLRESLAVRRRSLPDTHPYLVGDVIDLGRALREKGELAEAEELLREAVRKISAARGDDSRGAAVARSELGRCLFLMGRYDEAERELLDGHRVLRDIPDSLRKRPMWPETANLLTLEWLSELYEAWDAAEPGQGHAEKAAEWRKKLPPDARARLLMLSASELVGKNRYSEAEPALRECLKNPFVIVKNQFSLYNRKRNLSELGHSISIAAEVLPGLDVWILPHAPLEIRRDL